MLQRIRIDGLGPIETADLELGMGVMTLTGPSEVGKTSVMEATCFALWATDSDGKAFPVEAIRDGADDMSVELTLASGMRIYRKISRKNRKQVRKIVSKGIETEYALEDSMTEALGILAEDKELLRLVMVPYAWQPMATQNARKLRDNLSKVLPEVDLRHVVDDIMLGKGWEMGPHDPIIESDAVEARRVANLRVTKAEGVLEAVTQMLDDLRSWEPPPPPPDSRVRYATCLEEHEAWKTYLAAHRRWSDRDTAIKEWDQRNAELGDKPDAVETEDTGLAGKLTEARKKFAEIEMAYSKFTRVDVKPHYDIQREIDELEKAYYAAEDAKKAAPKNTVCPKCGRRGWSGAKDAKEKAQEAFDKAAKERDEKLPGLTKDFQAAQREWEDKRLEMWKELEAAKEAVQTMEGKITLSTTEDPVRAWEVAKRSLGQRPEPLEKPEAPPFQHPEDDLVKMAKDGIRLWDEHQGAKGKHESDLASAEKKHADSTAELARATDDANRLDALVAAVREAPSIVAQRQKEYLGDLGPVDLRFNRDPQRPAVEVLIDKRPWRFASTGKVLLADLYLRNAIRRAMGATWLPLFVDQTQDWSEALPEFAPMICLRTAPGTREIEVSNGG